MKIIGLSLVWILLFGVVTQGGMLYASAIEPVPLSPRNLTTSPLSDTKISLTWNPPINATGVTGYQIEYKTGSNSYSVLSLLGNLTTYLHTGLITNTTYTYRVSTINSAGTGNSSNESTATTFSVPSAPRNLSAIVISSSQINLSWAAPSSNGGTPINGYKILRENSCTGIFVAVSTTTNSSITYSDTGLAANTCYRYNVQAINGIGVSNATNNVTATTNSIPILIHVPSSPLGLGIKTISNTLLKLTWIVPSDNGGSPITGYLIQRNGTTIVNNTSSNKTSYTDTNLLPIHRQTYQIAAWNSAGLGTFSSSVSGITNSSIIPPFVNGTNQTSSNLGKLISDLEHKRNQLLKQQRQETLAIIHECHAQLKNVSADNKTQIKQDCKIKIKQSQQKYKDLKNQLKVQLAQLRAQFKLQIHGYKQERHFEREITHMENMTKHSENKLSNLANMTKHFEKNSENINNHLGNMTKHSENKLPNFHNMVNNFEKKSGKQNNHVKYNRGNGQQDRHQNDD